MLTVAQRTLAVLLLMLVLAAIPGWVLVYSEAPSLGAYWVVLALHFLIPLAPLLQGRIVWQAWRRRPSWLAASLLALALMAYAASVPSLLYDFERKGLDLAQQSELEAWTRILASPTGPAPEVLFLPILPSSAVGMAILNLVLQALLQVRRPTASTPQAPRQHRVERPALDHP